MAKKKVAKKVKSTIPDDIPRESADNFISFLTYEAIGFLVVLPILFIYLNRIQFYFFIDEKFHIPQTQEYCKGNFFNWDPKITTLPGLYLFSAAILGPWNLCTIPQLRFINLLLTYINLSLSFSIVSALNRNESASRISFLTAWNITFFPPLFFWFFLYYTDIFSVTLILGMLLAQINDRDKTAVFVGALSILVRQTNVIWVALVGIERGLTTIESITKKPEYSDSLNILPCVKTVYNIFRAEARKGIGGFFKFFMSTCGTIIPYALVLLSFVIFVTLNGGIVVGDKSAHIPTIHLTQIFYYSVFVLGFSWPYTLPYLKNFLKYCYQQFILLSIFACLITIIVHFNTLVHPYILADNRHYSFYIWKNLMNRYYFFKYLMVPVYTFAIYAILKSLSHIRLLSLIAYLLCVFIVLVPQFLLEPRYFIIPYIIFRLYQKQPSKWQIVAETTTTCLVNIAQFLLFVNKTFLWQDERYPQRIAW